MRLKSFYGKTATEAMAKVKQELGNDALILSSTQDGPHEFHITAAIEQHHQNTSYAGNIALTEQITEQIHDLFNAQKMPFETLQKIINEIDSYIESDIGKTLENFFSQKLSPYKNPHKIDYLIGSFGSGKTLSIIKLATQYHLQGLKLAIITTDHEKYAGIEPLESLAKFLNIEVTTVEDHHALKAAIEYNLDKDKILIDTAGMNPYLSDHLKNIKIIQATKFDLNTIFVTPSNVDPFELEDALLQLKDIKLNTICYTKLDLCQRISTLLHTIIHFDIPYHLFSNTESIEEGLKPIDSKEILSLLLSQNSLTSALKKVS